MIEFVSIFLIAYVLHALGVTIGYHRLISHRSFACPKPVEYFWVMLGYLAFEGSPIWWATIHRAHHRFVDTPLDPHSPRYGLYHAHVGWLMKKGYDEHVNPATQAKDLIDDPVYRFLEQGGDWHKAHTIAFSIGFLVRLLILLMFGWVAALASLLAAFAVLQIPLMLNVICHLPKFGYKNYAREDDSVNVWWVGILAMGEGWHNNHHAFPGSARTGMKFWEVDLSWALIQLMSKLRLASGIHEVSLERAEQLIQEARPEQLKPLDYGTVINPHDEENQSALSSDAPKVLRARNTAGTASGAALAPSSLHKRLDETA